jgi:hypothetical protein
MGEGAAVSSVQRDFQTKYENISNQLILQRINSMYEGVDE